MITDIFARRYAHVTLRDGFYRQDSMFLNQAATIITQQLWVGVSGYKSTVLANEEPLRQVHDILALELGVQLLSEQYFKNQLGSYTAYTYANICKNFLPTQWPVDPTLADEFIKQRLSFVELAFRRKAQEIDAKNAALPGEISRAELAEKMAPVRGTRIPGSRKEVLLATNAELNKWFAAKVDELNERLKLALYKLTYHNGLIQIAEDATSNKQIAEPFWPLVAGVGWTNVDVQMKEAIDRRDSNDRTAAFHAICALESAIKIISDRKGWTRGSERGAANYIDNLVSAANGRFIEVWEGDALKALFSEIRNPSAHGPGQAAPPVLSAEQTDWAMDSAMAWVKSLVKRL
jgi:hypothetical protein